MSHSWIGQYWNSESCEDLRSTIANVVQSRSRFSASGIRFDCRTELGLIQEELEKRSLICERRIIPKEHLDFRFRRSASGVVALERSGSSTLLGNVLYSFWGFSRVSIEGQPRSWIRSSTLRKQLVVVSEPVDSPLLCNWVRAGDFLESLRLRMAKLRIPQAKTLIANAACEPGWRGIVSLDAIVRQMTAASVGDVPSLWRNVMSRRVSIDPQYWFAQEAESEQSSPIVTGVMLLVVRQSTLQRN